MNSEVEEVLLEGEANKVSDIMGKSFHPGCGEGHSDSVSIDENIFNYWGSDSQEGSVLFG